MSGPRIGAAAEIAGWLIAEGRLQPAMTDLLAGFGERLAAAGVPVSRMFVGVHRLHPSYIARSYEWRRDDGHVEVVERPHGIERTEAYYGNPVSAIFERGDSLRCRLADPACKVPYPVLVELQMDGATDYVGHPLVFRQGARQAISFLSDDPGGFDDDALALIERLLPAIAAAVEIVDDEEKVKHLLSTYVGARVGEQVLAGSIRRGVFDSIGAALLLCDLVDFTPISERLPRAQLIALLDAFFDAVVAPIERRGGEVLKFMGDAVLAIFPLPGLPDGAADAVARAAAAAIEATEATDALDDRLQPRLGVPVRSHIALHVGEVAYGNIGAAERLDFTVVGPAVNLAARIEELTGEANARILVSEDFARLYPQPAVPIGRWPLKGIARPQKLFRLDAGSGRGTEPR